jgi:hypothetical protein
MVMAQVQGLLDVQITLEPYASQDQYGVASYGAVRTVKARIEQGMRYIHGPTGQSLVANFKVLLGEPVLVDPRDRLTLPKEFGSRDASGDFVEVHPPIITVRPVFFQGRHDHTVLYC